MSERFLITADTVHPRTLERDVLFDTNLWLRIEGCLLDPASHATIVYSGFYRKVLEQGLKIYLPQVVVGEFVGVSLKVKARAAGWDGSGKIHQHPDFPEWMRDISDDLYHIAGDCVQVDDGFAGLDLTALFEANQSFRLDFNDMLISQICVARKLRLVTDDADLCSQPCSIITGNRRLIDRSPPPPPRPEIQPEAAKQR